MTEVLNDSEAKEKEKCRIINFFENIIFCLSTNDMWLLELNNFARGYIWGHNMISSFAHNKLEHYNGWEENTMSRSWTMYATKFDKKIVIDMNNRNDTFHTNVVDEHQIA